MQMVALCIKSVLEIGMTLQKKSIINDTFFVFFSLFFALSLTMNFGFVTFLLPGGAVFLPTGWQVEMVGVTNGWAINC